MTQIAQLSKILSKFLAKFLTVVALATMMIAGLMSSEGWVRPVFAEESVTHPVYLPLVQSAPGTNPTTEPTPVTPTPPPPQASAFFADMEFRTSSASIATDAQGGIHVAYVYYQGLAEGVPTSGVYEFCARECDKAAQWQRVHLGEMVNEIQLELTPQGRPRILYRTSASTNGWNFYYGACDQQCGNSANWTLSHIASNEGMAPIETSDDELPQRYFALDATGRPRFVYGDRAGTHYGTFYAFCDQNCTDSANWFEVRINKDNGGNGPYRDEDFFHGALTFSATGQPRVVFDGVTMQDEFFLYYVACDGGCDQAQNWQSAPLFPRGSGFEFSYDVEINANGQPRIAYYEGAHANGAGNLLWYAWCDNACTQSGNWARHQLGLAVLEGQEPDLELESNGKPHIAYALYGNGGLGYSVCSSQCEGTSAQWQHQVIETRTTLANAWTVPHPLICTGGQWNSVTPTLSLDGGNKPHIAYDATYHARCHYIHHERRWETWHEMNLVWRAVRVHLTGNGAIPGEPTTTPTVTPTVTPETPTATVTPNTPTVTPTPTPPLPARQGKGHYPEIKWRTGSSDVALDSENGTHMAYVHIESLFGPDPDGPNNPTSAVYRTCQSGCDNTQNWSSVSLGEAVSEVQVGVTPNNKPRLLLLVRAQLGGEPADRYVYGACEQDCTSAAGWTLTPLVTVPNDLSWHWLDDPNSMEDSPRELYPRRSFALDPAGRPAFIYYHYNSEADLNGVGAYYAACETGCTDAANWTHTRITETEDWSGELEWEILEEPVLTFTPDGKPRVLAAMLPLGILRFAGMYYLACDVACDDGSNWGKVQVGTGDDANGQFDLAIDPAGRPYVVNSFWWQDGLRYGWCDADCLNFESWQMVQGPALDIQDPDLELDAQGRPYVVHRATEYDETGNNPVENLIVLKCTNDCRTLDAQWEGFRIETNGHMRAEWPAAIPAACAEGKWYQQVPTLVLGAGGTARIALDGVFVAPCDYDAGSGSWQPGGEYVYSTVLRAARLVNFTAP